MRRFARLFTTLDQTTKTLAKTAALTAYFEEAPDDDKIWTIALLSGRRPKRSVNATRLSEWAAERADLPMWLFKASYDVVGDLAETIHLVLPEPEAAPDRSLSSWINDIRGLARLEESERKRWILQAWDRLEGMERFVFNKLITGGFRVGVSQKLMTRALSRATGIDEAELAHRLMGGWTPETTSFATLVTAPDPEAALSRPYPFCLAYGVEDAGPASLGPPEDWRAEWKWDGIRGQLILRGGQHFLWSRGEELMTDRFPEFARAADFLPDGTVLDGEILAWDSATETPMGFAALQRRIGRKTVPKKVLSEAPAILRAYDLLEQDGADLRARPFVERRARLEAMLADLPREAPVAISPLVPFDDWDKLAEIRAGARDAQAEGLMLKRADSPYHVGRKKGDWWKWKLAPLSIDAVMVYAQAGHGRRANLYTDFTFAVWKGNELVPFTKAYSGLTDAEFRKITHWVRRNTLARFGPVRQVPPEHVFEIGFEGIQRSTRHKSGVALRFPRMLRWRQDKPVQEANNHDDLMEMLETYG
ncbi:putative ATP-dependent DNA ligase YkoU [Jannaschia seosinensis]|uniref:DNA ligase (ATP) n=1 Tax=Jannaschia seosinensis TaxID=313367 RepID=A0A0M7B5C8_9RHOB|nr:ATP-dependent DNA ligase [Jannaschia seosinensis]CUH26308.1 putative ATP-dependent DNA ligase YkoU [Jannaschia seosinensis]